MVASCFLQGCCSCCLLLGDYDVIAVADVVVVSFCFMLLLLFFSFFLFVCSPSCSRESKCSFRNLSAQLFN